MDSASSRKSADNDSCFLALPFEMIMDILPRLDAVSLASLSCCCTFFRARDKQSMMRVVDRAAKDKMIGLCGTQLSERWRKLSWLERLHVEEAAVGFDQKRSESQGFQLTYSKQQHATKAVLQGSGPKLLVSDVSTAHQKLIRWRLCVKGNTAVEFGVVPVSLQDQPKTLHKCDSEGDGDIHSVGFCSSITVGSQLSQQVPLMKGSTVEMLARRGHLEVLITHPANGQVLYWASSKTSSKPYRGPLEMQLEQRFSTNYDVKLALTSWALGAFDVLHCESELPSRAPASDSCASCPVSDTSSSDTGTWNSRLHSSGSC